MSEYQAQTDEVTQIKLPSTIQQVVWNKAIATVGTSAGLEIFTHFVSNGSEVEIQIKDEKGKKFDKIKTKIAGNHLRKSIRVPEKAKEALYAEVKLSKHKLKGKSTPLSIIPPVEITNLKWSATEARRGDILTLSADIKGLPDGVEVELQIWEHDQDGAHDLITYFPVTINDSKIEADWEFEYHEDTDDIPAEDETEKGYHPPEYFFRVNAYGVSVDSELLEFKDWIEINFVDFDGVPLSGKAYQIYTADGNSLEGKTNENGVLKLDNLPPGKISASLPGYPRVKITTR